MSDMIKTTEGIATVVIAIFVAFIGAFQLFTARQKLLLDLYNRRFEIYLRTVDFMWALKEWEFLSDVAKVERRIAFMRAMRESRYLFAGDASILNLLEEFDRRSVSITGRFDSLNKFVSMTPHVMGQAVDADNKAAANMAWILSAITRFELYLDPYLAFGNRKFSRSRRRKAT